MKVTERALQIWPVLAWAARNRQTLTYDQLGRLTGVLVPGLGQCLEPIQAYCAERGLPPLTALVVSVSTGLPGAGFTGEAGQVPELQARAFGHDWIAEGCPRLEDLEAAIA